MKKILVFALALMLAVPALAFADGNDADITAQGTVVVTAAPDMVTVTANASVSGRSVADAQEGMNAIIQSATQKLLDLGVEEKDIVTTSYTYYPTYDYNSETATVNGYQGRSHAVHHLQGCGYARQRDRCGDGLRHERDLQGGI